MTGRLLLFFVSFIHLRILISSFLYISMNSDNLIEIGQSLQLLIALFRYFICRVNPKEMQFDDVSLRESKSNVF